MMLAMVERQGLRRHMGLEGVLGEGEGRENKSHRGDSPSEKRAGSLLRRARVLQIYGWNFAL
ncbi:unnamed protein product [Pararhodospirillum photometricum DSM 122]|uniref:Uncharacterized protein n=1 Tax=Pararhodospirillum photometricum DSM 122 TaxID=1150469 RepID=H6SLW8_PARPM|nr:unnamed protein product [Pararhodospirillum photometricum DSM 122]